MVRITIGGDVNPTGINLLPFQEGDADAILGDLRPVFQHADLTMVNLECPLLGQRSPIQKSGPVLGVAEQCVAGIAAAEIDIVGLANNHIMDHGVSGLESTLRCCEEYGILHVGAGRNLSEAGGVLVRAIGGIRIGVMGVAEHEFGVATRDSWGVNPLDPVAFVRTLAEQRSSFDYLIVLLHGGNEHYPYPRPSLMDTCRFLVEQGANAVVCQHSHCPGCYEDYRGGHIVYGQGNLISGKEGQRPSWYEGFLVCLEVESGGTSHLQIAPYLQSKNGPGAHKMEAPAEEEFRRAIAERSRAIQDADFVERQWDQFCADARDLYLRRLGSPHRVFRALDRLTRCIQLLYRSPRQRLEHLNLVRCESHREVLINILSKEDR
jgi:poly-gamma-glutamate synthesis protein (capsule biosynthesis protein)